LPKSPKLKTLPLMTLIELIDADMQEPKANSQVPKAKC